MKKALPLVVAQEQIKDRNRLEEEAAEMRGGRTELGCGEAEPGAPKREPSALAFLLVLDEERERKRGRRRWVPGGNALAGTTAGGREEMACPCAPKVPDGLVDLEAKELSGAGQPADEPVPIYNAPALSPTEASRREAISGSPVHAKVETRPAAEGGAARQALPLGLMALATGGPTRGRAGRGVGETPTTPPAPVAAGPVFPGPIPPPTYQSPAPGLVPVAPACLDPEPAPARPGPGGRQARIDQAQTRRFRRMAEEALLVIKAASRAGAATAEDRLAARAFADCMDKMTSALGDFGRVVARLRRADQAGTAAVLTLDEVDALEAFASCAKDILARRRGA
jgi:hypothetical protein